MMIKQCGFREEPHGCYLHCTTQLKKKQELLDGAKLGYDFLNKHCFDNDGQMFFHVARDGKPICKRRYFFSETFYVIAAAAYAKASGDEKAASNARKILVNAFLM